MAGVQLQRFGSMGSVCQPFVMQRDTGPISPRASSAVAPAATEPRVWGMESDTGGRWQVSTAGGVQPRWAHDSTELFYLAADKTLMTMKVRPNRVKFEAGMPSAMFTVAIRQFDGPWAYAVAPDNKRFLVDAAVSE